MEYAEAPSPVTRPDEPSAVTCPQEWYHILC